MVQAAVQRAKGGKASKSGFVDVLIAQTAQAVLSVEAFCRQLPVAT